LPSEDVAAKRVAIIAGGDEIRGVVVVFVAVKVIYGKGALVTTATAPRENPHDLSVAPMAIVRSGADLVVENNAVYENSSASIG
jgi:hypothetical protein